MKAIAKILSGLWKDEQGGEVLEYALVAGLIVVAAIGIISAIGTKVAALELAEQQHVTAPGAAHVDGPASAANG